MTISLAFIVEAVPMSLRKLFQSSLILLKTDFFLSPVPLESELILRCLPPVLVLLPSPLVLWLPSLPPPTEGLLLPAESSPPEPWSDLENLRRKLILFFGSCFSGSNALELGVSFKSRTLSVFSNSSASILLSSSSWRVGGSCFVFIGLKLKQIITHYWLKYIFFLNRIRKIGIISRKLWLEKHNAMNYIYVLNYLA